MAPSQGGSSRGLTAADVVNDGAKTARVRIDGAVNGVPFVVERSTRRWSNCLFNIDWSPPQLSAAHGSLQLAPEQSGIKGSAAAQRSRHNFWPTDSAGRAAFFIKTASFGTNADNLYAACKHKEWQQAHA